MTKSGSSTPNAVDGTNEFKVEASTNGTTWTTVAEGVGFGWKRPITFDQATARQMKITQTGIALNGGPLES